MRFEIKALVHRSSGFTLEASETCDAEALGLVGPSGSGKSTLLDAVAGIEPGARVVLDGVDCSCLPLHLRGVGYVAQDALLFPHLSVRQNLLYSPRAVALGHVPHALGIEPLLDRMPRHLSGGERRRVALGRAILSRPRVLLLDEPFGGLDEPRRREAMSLLEHVRRTFNIPMILVSHLADEVIGLTDWAVRLEEGRVAARGPSAVVLRTGETRIDNYFEGTAVTKGRVRVGEIELAAMIPDGVTGEVRMACYAHDILLASAPPEGISARNVFPVTIESAVPTGDAVLVAFVKPRLSALVTPEAVESLGIRPGSSAVAILKATSVVYLGPA
jgi:molybdate transport system ATP-binding protein